ncbi:RNA-binding protein, G-patch type (predicted) [Sugiyamaella lignohabitans]|uniref:RNA-binding protein, G-patch type (Predicted) n=1 Tax=Sugiyamaella lignohabitans TaxID=796027 RepID=A0A161HFQ8_9ASCO|nr:RNA-binding protein, G-patch type (predicted) [Sugiyamaella lignohabitans]ANB11431.1 RNA-binding protein, G-patch type (predicted) [Sugiyamaella lignohabitans]
MNKNVGLSVYDLINSEEHLEEESSQSVTVALRFRPVKKAVKKKDAPKEVKDVINSDENKEGKQGDQPKSQLVYFAEPVVHKPVQEQELEDAFESRVKDQKEPDKVKTKNEAKKTEELSSTSLPRLHYYAEREIVPGIGASRAEYTLWTEDYDPLHPNSYHDYKESEEKLAEDQDWLDYLLNLRAERDREQDGNVRYGLDYGSKGSGANESEDEDQLTSKETEAETGDQEEQGEDDNIDEEEEKEDVTLNQKSATVPPGDSFAASLLKKYGWKPGKGLGKSSNGIVRPLVVIASKKRPGSGRIVQSRGRKRQKKQRTVPS